MSLGRVPYFITIAETGNITKAAQILRVSQPSLSQYLTRLEAEVGMPLLHRNCTPIRLTEAGKIYLEYVKQLVKACLLYTSDAADEL